MRARLVLLFQVLLIALASIFLGWKVWFDMWMYHGWIGPPGVLAKVLNADGERAYDAAMDEMSIICFVALISLFIAIKIALRRKFNSP